MGIVCAKFQVFIILCFFRALTKVDRHTDIQENIGISPTGCAPKVDLINLREAPDNKMLVLIQPARTASNAVLCQMLSVK